MTLLDGRSFDLDDSNDVDWDNKGILVLVEAEGTAGQEPDGEWRFIDWDDFLEVRFDHRDRGARDGGAS